MNLASSPESPWIISSVFPDCSTAVYGGRSTAQQEQRTDMIRMKYNNGTRPRRAEAGMTLVEVAMAMGVAGLAIMGIINGYMFCTQSARESALSLAASARAVERLEQTRAASWQTSSYPQVCQLVASNFPPETVTLDLPSANGAITYATNYITISQISTNPPLMQVRVDCVWSFPGTAKLQTNTIQTCRAPDS